MHDEPSGETYGVGVVHGAAVSDETMTRGAPVVIVGAGGHGREVADLALAAGLEVEGLVDDGTVDLDVLSRSGLTFLGPIDQVLDRQVGYLIGIGYGTTRSHIAGRLASSSLVAASAVHPQASVGSDTRTGLGLVMCVHTSITTNVRVGDHVHLNRGATIGHDCRVGHFVTLNPGAVVSGNVTIGDEVTIGSGAVVLEGLNVGARAVIGAGSVVTRDLPADIVAYGNPARIKPAGT